ncbi:MAG: GntR family transcriptional regulator [Lautropia sp.]
MKPSDELRLLKRLRARSWSDGREGPKYRAVVEALSDAIRAEGLRPGDRLPGESEIVAATPFSLGTVQRALRAMSDQGLLERRQGHGTFVRNVLREMNDPLQCRFVGPDGALLPIYPRVLDRIRVAQTGPWTAFLGQRRDNILRVDRIIDVADVFAVFTRFYVRVDRHPELETLSEAALNGESFTRLLSGSAPRPIEFTQTVISASFSEGICRAIGIHRGSAGLVLSTFAYDSGAPIYYQEIYVPPGALPLKLR